MKVLVEGKIEAAKIDYKVQVDQSKLSVVVDADLAALVDEGAAKLPQSALEVMIVGLVKQGIASL